MNNRKTTRTEHKRLARAYTMHLTGPLEPNGYLRVVDGRVQHVTERDQATTFNDPADVRLGGGRSNEAQGSLQGYVELNNFMTNGYPCTRIEFEAAS